MNIYIFNAYNTFNYGAMMMAENFIHYLDAATGAQNTYFVEANSDITGTRLAHATGNPNIRLVPINGYLRHPAISVTFVLQYLLLPRPILFHPRMQTIDAVVFLGGDSLSQEYGVKSLIMKFARIHLLARRRPTWLMGHTMGPFSSLIERVTRAALAPARGIYVRETLSRDYLRGIGLTRIAHIPDLALAPLARDRDDRAEKDRICFFPSVLLCQYARERSYEAFVRLYVRMLEELAAAHPGLRLVMIPHVIAPEVVDDRRVGRAIMAAAPKPLLDRIEWLDAPIYPYEVRQHVRRSLYVVSGRMHPLVSAMTSGTPGIALSYSRKYHGVLGAGYGLSDFVIDVREHDTDSILRLFSQCRERLVREQDRIAAEIITQNRRDCDAIGRVFDRLANEIRAGVVSTESILG